MERDAPALNDSPSTFHRARRSSIPTTARSATPPIEVIPFKRGSLQGDAIKRVIEESERDARARSRSADIDPNESPFELQPIEGLPLTDAEREELRHFLAELDAERAKARWR